MICSICNTDLPDPKASYGSHDWPICWDCHWWTIEEHKRQEEYHGAHVLEMRVETETVKK